MVDAATHADDWSGEVMEIVIALTHSRYALRLSALLSCTVASERGFTLSSSTTADAHALLVTGTQTPLGCRVSSSEYTRLSIGRDATVVFRIHTTVYQSGNWNENVFELAESTKRKKYGRTEVHSLNRHDHHLSSGRFPPPPRLLGARPGIFLGLPPCFAVG